MSPIGTPTRESLRADVRAEVPFCIPTSALSLKGFREWATSEAFPDRVRAAFLGSEIWIDMSPERYGSHNAVKTEITRVLGNLVRDGKLGIVLGDGMLLTNVEAEVSNQPDGCFVSAESIRTGRVRLIPSSDGQDFTDLEGSPDMVLEVVSPSSVSKDTRDLPQRYHRAGVREYWLVDARGESVDFVIYRRGDSEYEPAASEEEWQTSDVFGHAFRLEQTEQFGWIEYTLHLRPIDF